MISEAQIKIINEIASRYREAILSTADYIWKNPETGYRERKTSAHMLERFRGIGYKPVEMKNIPGFYADLETGRSGPTLAILGELDSVICRGHPDADGETGAVHACGHHTQSAYLFGAAAIMKDKKILSELCGKIRFVSVPAEELIELGYRAGLRERGVIKYLGGKVEFMHRGVFDGVDAVVMAHSGGSGEKRLRVYKGNNGCMAKNITYIGKASHAGGAPERGVNALYAAALGIQAINSIRETFTEENITRVHPIITEGGAAVNVIPEIVKLESFVRGATPDAIVNENKKVNRALAGAAVSLGARVRVSDIPGYMPLHNNAGLNELTHKIGVSLFGEENVEASEIWNGGSTDMGDLCCVLPVAHPSVGGGEGTGHGEDYRIIDSETACVGSARLVAGLACALLSRGGAELLKIKENYKPLFPDFKSYFDFVDKIFADRELVKYDGERTEVAY